ncbi:3-oxoacyl-ACP reductase [Acrocarpospora phusangensis]|uniref:3-oxoacyl-ACP reductase n=1 Tax=Acrocarpospora phusangensis TaxID=1070424 RepID=A0A919QDD2_9ACTN|nr:SDR family oxidoreductase [Acrocarpospora phusangensis]GIH25881.1 3-oxoacyl-ACP reductase [Acrocarpospora phusangensis]
MELDNQVALVTGGTAGIGLETARGLAAAGAEVVITGRDVERGKQAVDTIDTIGSGRVRFVQADLSDLASVAALAEQAGPVDVLVNNAGSFPAAPTVEQDVPGFEMVFNTNVRGPYFLVAMLVPHMLEQGRGAIVNVTTLATLKGYPGASVYSASKSALASLTRTWAVEFAPHVRVNSVAPGSTRTEGVLVEWGEGVEELGRAMPLGRTGRAREIAEAVVFLASPRASYVTGSTIHVDGGGTAV